MITDFSHAAGEIRLLPRRAGTFAQGDMTGDGWSDWARLAKGGYGLTAAGFILQSGRCRACRDRTGCPRMAIIL